MSGSRSFASLSSTLLSRKGGARPAMRPQLGVSASDDLGWNDMGTDVPVADVAPAAAAIVAHVATLTPHAPATGLLARKPQLAEVVPFAREVAVTAPPATGLAQKPDQAPVRRTRPAAFTLRIDPDRHLRLRLACQLQGRSAQALVTEAVDRFLADLPEIEPMAERTVRQRLA